MIARQLKSFLDQHHIRYRTINHSPAYTAPEVAAISHIPGRELAKTVIIKVDGRLAMLIEPANTKLNLNLLKDLIGAKQVELASEYEFERQFPDCETGAMPPFGNLYHMDVWVDHSLMRDQKIFFNGGTHTDLIEMSFNDFIKLVKPNIIKLH